MFRLNGWNRLGIIFSLIWLLVVALALISELNEGPRGIIELVEVVHTTHEHTLVNRTNLVPCLVKACLPLHQQPATKVHEFTGKLDAVTVSEPKIRAHNGSLDAANKEAEGFGTSHIVDPFDISDESRHEIKAGMFDDLIPRSKLNYRIQIKNSLLFALIPILFFWIFAYVSIWSIRWIVDGFKSNVS